MIRLFATDLDHTLLNKLKQIDEHNLQALEKLQQAGVQVTVASGRNELEIEHVVHNVPGDFHRICQNGAFVYLHSNELIYEHYFHKSLAQAVYRLGKTSGLGCFIGTATQIFIPEEIKLMKLRSERISVKLEIEPAMEQRLGDDLLPSKFCYAGEERELKQLQKILNDAFPEQLDSFLSTPYLLDVMPKGVNKGNGIRQLANRLGISLSEVACIGDSENDLAMFNVTPHSFVMDIAKPSIQKSANRVVSSVAQAVTWVLHYNQQLMLQK